MKTVFPLLVGFFSIVLFRFSQAQDAAQIIKAYCDTVSTGNMENWYAIKNVYSETFHTFNGEQIGINKNTGHHYKEYLVFPRTHVMKSYSDTTFSVLTAEFYFLPDKMITIVGNVPPIIKPPRVQDEYSLDPVRFNDYLNHGTPMLYNGLKRVRSDTAWFHEIEVERTDHRRVRYYFNARTYLYEYSATSRDGKIFQFTHYFNYRRQGNFLIPMSQVVYTDDKAVQSKHIRVIKFNVDIDSKEIEYRD